MLMHGVLSSLAVLLAGRQSEKHVHAIDGHPLHQVTIEKTTFEEFLHLITKLHIQPAPTTSAQLHGHVPDVALAVVRNVPDADPALRLLLQCFMKKSTEAQQLTFRTWITKECEEFRRSGPNMPQCFKSSCQ